ncbi:MAG: hypothetical protein IJ772_01930 [Bacilli bacterium]|nr:hypothetical protein [Bacilli bacterium]
MEFERINTPKEFLEYMNNNITYGFIGKNGKKYQNFSSEEWLKEGIVQNGEEVLKSKIGTCYDQVELERLWFENHHFEAKTIFIWFEVDYENNYPTHTFLVYKNNHKWYWFEHAFEDCRGIHEFESLEETINTVISKQLEYAISIGIAKESDKHLIKSYEYTKITKPMDIEEFLNHATRKEEKL